MSHTDVDAERAYLSAVFRDRAVHATHSVPLEAFSSREAQATLNALLCTTGSSTADLITALRSADADTAIGFALDVTALFVSDASVHASRIKRLASRRQVIASAQAAIQLASDGDDDGAASVLERVSASQRASATSILTQRELLVLAVESCLEIRRVTQDGVHDAWPTLGLHPELDKIHRAAPGDLIVIGADPNVGKTTVLQMICASLAQRKVPTAIVSCEDPAVDLAIKRLSSLTQGHDDPRARVGLQELWHGTASYKQWSAMQGAVHDASLDAPLYTACVEVPTVDEVVATIETLARERAVKLVAVDYLQCIQHRDGTSLRERIDATLDALIAVAKRAQVILVLASQLSRPPAKSEREPTKYDLKESSTIEARAQVILLLWREARHHDVVHCKVEKMKRGPVGLRFDFERSAAGHLTPVIEQSNYF